jgi:hypothetical protein
MSGHVFHPGHAALHGMTVVVETRNERTYIGRYDSEDQVGVHILDAAIHDPTTAQVPKDEYIRKCTRFGIASQHKHVIIPTAEVLRIARLSEVS